MERYDSTMRAARYLFGAGTFAAAMLTMGVGQVSAATLECKGEAPYVCGHVFTETNSPSDGYQPGEGTPNITVELIDKSTDSTVDTTTSYSSGCPGTDDCGYYEFATPTVSGNYKVCVTVDGTTTCKDVTQQIVDLPIGTGRPQDAEPPYDHYNQGQGTGTPGYWKNHPEAWPAEGVTVGGVLYKGPTIQTAIKLMGKVGGDKTYSMFSALIAAKLNTMPSLNNDYSCVAGTIFDADAWMTVHPVGGPTPVKASSAAWQQAEDWHQRLDDFNNGKLCAHHRD